MEYVDFEAEDSHKENDLNFSSDENEDEKTAATSWFFGEFFQKVCPCHQIFREKKLAFEGLWEKRQISITDKEGVAGKK